MIHRVLFLLAALLVVPLQVLAWEGMAVEVRDCRTLAVERDGQTVEVSLYGIDCPQPSEPFGQEAREFTASQVLDQEVKVTVHRELSGRLLAEVTPLGGKASLNVLLLREGLAWVHEAYCEKARLCGAWERIQGESSAAERGLWSEVPENMPAWRWLQGGGLKVRPGEQE